MPQSDNRFFICLSMWNNMFQQFFPVGTIVYDLSFHNKTRMVGFVYNKEHLELGLPAIDPANLDPAKNGKNGGKFVSKNGSTGQLPHYFAEFLPGPFGDDLISDINDEWKKLTETEKLYVMTHSHGDYGAPRLDAYKDQHNNPIRNIHDLTSLVTAIREYQAGHTKNPLTPEIQGALCNMKSHKPMIDFEAHESGIDRRFVVKLNQSGFYNDARMSAMMTSVQQNGGVNVCDGRVVPLSNGEDVLFSYNYSRTERYDTNDDGDKNKVILKYNRVSFRTLLAEDDFLAKGDVPGYRHIAHAIRLYSDDPEADLMELFSRAFLSAATNHTSNGLDNMEMFDDGAGKWRLSPSYNNLPNPMTCAEFDCSFSERTITGNLLYIDEEFVHDLSDTVGISHEAGERLALKAGIAIQGIDKLQVTHALSDNDISTVQEVVKFNQIDKLVASLGTKHDIGNTGIDVEEIDDIEMDDEPDGPSYRGPGM